jgi:ABC-type antimicrobial peptide transport system permease subunit
LSQILRRDVYGISNLDLIAYLIAIAVFGLTAALSAVVPARRALLVDPLNSLRHE